MAFVFFFSLGNMGHIALWHRAIWAILLYAIEQYGPYCGMSYSNMAHIALWHRAIWAILLYAIEQYGYLTAISRLHYFQNCPHCLSRTEHMTQMQHTEGIKRGALH